MQLLSFPSSCPGNLTAWGLHECGKQSLPGDALGGTQHPLVADEAGCTNMLAPLSEADLPGLLPGDATMPPVTQASGLKPFTNRDTRFSQPSKLPTKWGLEKEALRPPLPLESITCGRLSEPQTVLPSGPFYDDRCPLTCCPMQ